MKQNVDQKRIAAIKGQTTRMQTQVEGLDVNDEASLQLASDLRSRIKQYDKAMAKEKKEWLDPVNALRKKIFDTFKPFENQVSVALGAVDGKIIAYEEHKAEEARKAEEKLQARIDKGTLKPDTAMRKMEEMETPDTMITGEHGKTVIQERSEVVVVDVNAIPREYLEPNMAAIKQAVMREGKQIPGVEIVTKKVLASRS